MPVQRQERLARRRLVGTWVVALLLLAVPGGGSLSQDRPADLSGAQAPPAATRPTEEARPQTRPEVDPHRRRSVLYVAARGSSEVLALGRDTGEVIASIPVGRGPSGLAARADGDRIYVACAGAHAVQVIDGATRAVLDTVTLPHGSAPADVALDSDERILWVAAAGRDALYALDAASLQQVAEIPVGREPVRLAVSPDGRRVAALCARAGRVDVVDADARRVVGSVAVGPLPSDLIFDAAGSLHVVRAAAPVLMSAPEGAASATEIPLEAPGEALALDSDRRRLLVASPASGRILLVSPGSGAAVKVYPIEQAGRLAVDPEGRTLYALSPRRGRVTWIDRVAGTVEREVPAGKEPWDLVLIP